MVGGERPSRCYDLPVTRILSRAARRQRVIERSLLELNSGISPERAESASAGFIQDIVFLRLAEFRDILERDRIQDFIPRNNGEIPGYISLLNEFNEKTGLDIFEPELYESLAFPTEETRAFLREVQSRRFFPADMPEELLGALLEVLSSRSSFAGDRKLTGRFYTPSRIVDKVLDQVIPDVVPKGSLLSEEVYILDPCCGSGNFLYSAYRRLLRHEERYLASRASGLFYPLIRLSDGTRALDWDLRRRILEDHLFGVDLDLGALNCARRGLVLIALRGFNIKEMTQRRLDFLRRNLRQGDSLIDRDVAQQAELFDAGPPRPLIPFVWQDPEAGFGDILSGGGFHAVVGNPPWLSLKGRHRVPAYTSGLVEYLLEEFDANTYRPNLFEMFIRRSVELLRDGGYNAFVVPDRMAYNLQFKGLREFLLEQGEVMRLHFGEPFPGVVADTLVYLFRKTSRSGRRHKLLISDASGRRKEFPQGFFVKQRTRLAQGSAGQVLCGEAEVFELLLKIERSGKKPLRDFFDTGVGFIARPGRISLERSSPAQRAVIKGEHIIPYSRQGKAYMVFEDRNLAGGTQKLNKLSHPDRLLVRKTGPRLVAAIDSTGDLPEQSLYFLNLRNRRLCRGYDLHYFLGLLNSNLLTFYFRNRLITNPFSTPHLKKVHLDVLPLRPVRFKEPEDARAYEKLVELVKERAGAGRDDSELDRKIDQVVFDLYGLSASERKLVESLAIPHGRVGESSGSRHTKIPGPRK